MEKKKILLIDDAILSHIMVKQALGDEYNVETSLSGREGLLFMENDKIPDLILISGTLHDIAPLEVLKSIKNMPGRTEIPVILILPDSNPQIENEAYAFGVADILIKPYQPSMLKECVGNRIALSEYVGDTDGHVTKTLVDMENMYDFIVLSFAALIESRESVVGGRLKNTSMYFDVFIKHLAEQPAYEKILTPVVVKKAIRTAPLHDVGKISVRDAVLQKPGALNDEEFEEMKMHTVSGGEFFDYLEVNIADKDFAHIAGQMARSHHERWDGRGYPDKLSGEKIPFLARIMSIVDTYDAMTSRRPYKEPMSHDKAMSIIAENGGSQFDPALVEEFVNISSKIKEVLDKKNSGEALQF